jgi:hypothetical protein
VGTLPKNAEGRPGQGGPQNSTSPATKVADRRLPTAYASVFVPQGSRTWYWLTFRCPTCDTYVFARCRGVDGVTKPRKATCGHRMATVAARIYGAPGGETA